MAFQKEPQRPSASAENLAGYVTRVHGETFSNLAVKFSGEVARYLPLGPPDAPETELGQNSAI